VQRKLRGIAGNFERADLGLLASVGVLLFVGIFVVYGAGSFNRQAASSPLGQHFIIAKHLFMMGVGFVAMFGLMNLDYHWFRARWLNWGGLIVCYFLVGLTLLGNPVDSNGHAIINRWIRLGPISVQPVELAKIAMIFFLAERLSVLKPGRSLSPRQLGLALTLGPLPLLYLLVQQPNYGNAMVIVGVTLIILFVAGVSDKWVMRAALAMPVVGTVGYFAISKIQTRIDFLKKGLFDNGSYGYQVDQSLIGLGAGGLKGLGIGHSRNKFSFLPESHTDFAFSVLGEEWGLFGSLLVISMLMLFAWRGYGIAARAADPFGRFVATGLTTGIVIYGVTNIAMVVGLFPVVGVPLPFISFGGTAMVAALASVGILLSIDRGSQSYQMWKRRWDRSGTV
jgi:cell division protein FtsW